MTITKPMLAASLDTLESIVYPVLASPKIDGIRCLKVGGKAVSRKFKDIQNHYIRKMLSKILPEGSDGEIVVGDTFQETSSAVMSHDGEPNFTFCMFDLVQGNLEEPFQSRIYHAGQWIQSNDCELDVLSHVNLVPHVEIRNEEELLAYEADILELGYEGVMLRSPHGPYKCGRSTLKQGYLVKLKRFVDGEAEILSITEMMENKNTAETDELGYTKRSGHQANFVGKNTLGSFQVMDLETGIEFDIGTGEGLTQELRKELWEMGDELVGKIIKYKSQPTGVKTAPRFPVFLGFRDPGDM